MHAYLPWTINQTASTHLLKSSTRILLLSLSVAPVRIRTRLPASIEPPYTKPPAMPAAKRKRLKLPSKPPSNGYSPLMAVSVEVRMRIYKYVFQRSRISIEATREGRSQKATHRRCEILLGCKTSRQEAQPILAKTMVLVLDRNALGTPLCEKFSAIYFRELRHLQLSVIGCRGFLQSMFPKLQRHVTGVGSQCPDLCALEKHLHTAARTDTLTIQPREENMRYSFTYVRLARLTAGVDVVT